MTAAKSKPSGQEIYNSLRAQILSLELVPGIALDEFTLADAFGVSRSPIRHAVARLSAEGLVRTVGNRSIVSRLMDYKSFPQYVDALDLVQRALTRLAARRAKKADIEYIREGNANYLSAIKELDLHAMSEANKAFHLAIADVAENIFLRRYYETLLEEGQRLMHVQLDLVVAEHGSTLGDDHDDIIRMIVNHDEVGAEKAAHEHALLFRGRFMEYLKKQYTTEIDIEFQLMKEGVDDE